MSDEFCDYHAPSLTVERSHPNHWYNRAADLRASAGALWHSMNMDADQKVAQSLGLGPGYSMGVACWHVYHMLCGLAIEVVLKAVMSQRGIKIPEIHDLNNLAAMLGIDRTPHERKLLKFYSSAVVWSGRYPIPRKCSDEALRSFYDEAHAVLRKPLRQIGSLTLTSSSESTDWEHFHSLWCRFAEEFKF